MKGIPLNSNLLDRPALRTTSSAQTRVSPRTAVSSSSTHAGVNRVLAPEPAPQPKQVPDPLDAAIDRGLDITMSDDPRLFIDRSAQRSGE